MKKSAHTLRKGCGSVDCRCAQLAFLNNAEAKKKIVGFLLVCMLLHSHYRYVNEFGVAGWSTFEIICIARACAHNNELRVAKRRRRGGKMSV